MQTLFINACVRSESRTARLARCLLNRLDGFVDELCLQTDGPAPLNVETLDERSQLLAEGRLDAPLLRFARQFAAADRIVIAAPFWDLSFPAILKSYIESVCAAGVTFRYGEDGRPYGLCRAQSLIFITTSGGPFMPGFGFDYIKALAVNFFGIRDVRCLFAENLDIVGCDADAILSEAMKRAAEMAL